MTKLLSITFLLAVVLAILTVFLWKPLPETITERNKLLLGEPVACLLMYYPNLLLSFLGLPKVRVLWTRALFNLINFVQFSNEPGLAKVEDRLLGNVPVRIYVPEQIKHTGILFYIHGGGYVIGRVETHDLFVKKLSLKTQMVVCSIGYRLAPEYRFPSALDDVEHSIVHFVTEKVYNEYKVDPQKIILAGDSAGGAMATMVSQRLKNSKSLKNAVKLQILIYPHTQFVDLKSPSYQMSAKLLDGTTLLDADSLIFWFFSYLNIDMRYRNAILNNEHLCDAQFRRKYAKQLEYVQHRLLPFEKNEKFYTTPNYENCKDTLNSSTVFEKLMNPDFAPLMADESALRNLPQALIITCEFDPLRDDGYWYYLRLKNAGVKSTWSHYKEGFHGLVNLMNFFELGQQMLNEVGDFVDKNL